MCPDSPERKLAAILSADVVGYSRLMAEDEPGTIRTLEAYRSLISSLVHDHRGRVVDCPGDNLLAEFPNALDAVQCAIETQRVLQVRNQSLSEQRQMLFRVGVHLGDVTVEGERIYGDGVNIAARLEGLAEPGGICISGNVYDLVQSRIALDYDDIGEQSVKNIPRPVRAYRVRLETAAASPTLQSRANPRALFVAGVVVLLMVAGLLLWRQSTTARSITYTDREFTVEGFGDVPAIAVLPFNNLSDDVSQEYFADGIAEDLITRLSSLRELPVIARNSTFTYKGQAVDIQQVGRELGARYVVEGSVRKAESRIRISAQLIDAATGHHVWADTYDRELRDIFAVQDEITESIVGSLRPEILRSEISRASRGSTRNVSSYDLAMQGFWHFLNGTVEDIAKARSLFERAIAADPSNARAWAMLAEVHFLEIMSRRAASPAESLDELERAARACVAADNRSAGCYVALSRFYQVRGPPEEQIAALERALSLDPSSAFAHGWAGYSLSYVSDRTDDAIVHLEKAMRLDPRSPLMWLWLDGVGWAHFSERRYEEAIEWAKQSIRIYPKNSTGGYRTLAASYALLGRVDDARGAVEEALRVDPDLTLGKVRLQNATTRTDFLERWLDGLRKAGLPEG